ncbi:MAG: metallophosphoesterase family protein, partial [Candidatus Eisenbacteria bacterium]|nr:metallophosphoesterase family protein [Candidatus Eisenbacteria bacterium]
MPHLDDGDDRARERGDERERGADLVRERGDEPAPRGADSVDRSQAEADGERTGLQHVVLPPGTSRRIAVFGGVYNNYLALAAVLDDAARCGADDVFCLGDIGGFGPHPDRSLEILRESSVRTMQGNYDESVGHERADCGCGYSDPRDNHYAQISYDYTLAKTAPTHRTWMRALPAGFTTALGGRRVR